MNDSWPVVRLGDIAEITSSKRIRMADYVKSGVPFFRSKEIIELSKGNSRSTELFIAEEQFLEIENRYGSPKESDILLTSVGTLGVLYQVQVGDKFYFKDGNLTWFRNFSEKIDPQFLFCWLKSSIAKRKFAEVTIGSTQQALTIAALKSIKTTLPPLAEQKAIASVLGALDDKIENNRRMNETLEEMARAVFKSWFVDFDPVHAKATLQNHSPLEGESANQRQSPQMSRWGGIKRQYTSKAQQRAQTLRKNPTDAEGLLWHYLRKKQLAGRKFRRQQPIGNYIVDFVCMSEKLVIELDGSQHAKQKSYDANRDQFIQDSGYRVLRYWNNQVLSDCYAVLEDIYNHLCPPPHQSSPDGSTSATPPPGGSDNHPPLDIEPMAHPLDAPPGGSDNHPPLDLEPMAHPLDAPPGGSDNHPPLDIEPMAHPLDAPPGGSDNHPPLDLEPMAHPLDAPPGESDNHPPLEGGSNSATPNLGRGNWTLERAKRYLAHMNAETATLFPSTFGDDGLPVGWIWNKFLDFVSLTKGRSYKSAELQESDTALVTLKSFLRGGGYRADGLKSYTGKFNDEQVVRSGDLIVALTDVTQAADVIGKPAIVRSDSSFTTLVASLDVGIIRPKKSEISIPFLYCLMMTGNFQSHIYGHTSGTTVLHLSKDGVPKYEFILPPVEVMSNFSKMAKPIFSKIELNAINSKTLVELRDTLLPKLMSGEVRIKDAEREVRAAV